MFYTKYENKGDEFREFLVYFKSQWDSSRFKWFEGWLKDQPSTNNGLEATNRWIKNNYTNRTRKQLHEFIPICMNMLHCWSKDRERRNTFFEGPVITLSKETEAHQWAKNSTINS